MNETRNEETSGVNGETGSVDRREHIYNLELIIEYVDDLQDLIDEFRQFVQTARKVL
jgi:hypothetical protein